MRFPGGVVADCSTTYNFRGVNRYRALASDGWFGLDPAYSYRGIKGNTSKGDIELEQIDGASGERLGPLFELKFENVSEFLKAFSWVAGLIEWQKDIRQPCTYS